MSLTFEHLKKMSAVRNTQSFAGCQDWSVTDWGCALAGEAGEACDAIKKLRRLESGVRSPRNPANFGAAKLAVGLELADVVIYADLLASKLGLDLGELVKFKFDEVSRRVDSPILLSPQKLVPGEPDPRD